MTPEHFATILTKHRKVAIAGGPKTGKSTLVMNHYKLNAEPRPAISTDDINSEWETVPVHVRERLASYKSWILEGVQVGRCLRKGLKPDCVIYLKKPHVDLSAGQQAMTKGCRTIYEEWLEVVQRTEQFDSVDSTLDYEVVTLAWMDEE